MYANQKGYEMQRRQWESYKNIFENKTVEFFNTKYFFSSIKDGFDVVIGNPPYIKEYTKKNAFDGIRNSPYYQGKMDLWYLFACNGLDSLKYKGLLCFIATNNWLTNTGASKMRNKIIKEAKIERLLDFGSFMIFESADIQTMVMMFKNETQLSNYNFDFRRIIGKEIDLQDVNDLLQKNQTPKTEYLSPTISKIKFIDKPFTFSSSNIEAILQKIEEKGIITLDGDNEVAQGIVFPQDFVNKASHKKLNYQFNIRQGIFGLSDEEKNSIAFSKKELGLIKPYYTTEQLGRYYGISNNKLWLIYTNSKFKNYENIKPFPNIKKHIDKFRDVITSDNKPYGLHRAREERFFKGEKIITLRKCANKPVFTYTNFDCYVSATFYVIKTKRVNQKFLVALLNSTLIAFWLKNKGKMQGNNYQIDKEPLLNLPIVNPKNPLTIIDLVNQILQDKSQNQDTIAIEHKIDVLVYKLYEVNYDEVKEIDPDFWLSEEEYKNFK
jgi:adenine-specific DNA-methyltransferase